MFSNDGKDNILEPELWVKQGPQGIRSRLAKATETTSREVVKETKPSMDSKTKKSKAHGDVHEHADGGNVSGGDGE